MSKIQGISAITGASEGNIPKKVDGGRGVMNLHDKDQSPVLTGFPYSSASATEEVRGWPSPALFKSERASRATVLGYQSRNSFEEIDPV